MGKTMKTRSMRQQIKRDIYRAAQRARKRGKALNSSRFQLGPELLKDVSRWVTKNRT